MAFRVSRSVVSKTFLAALLFCAASLFAQTLPFITFDAPDAGTGSGQGTVGASINHQGVIAGYYFDSSNLSHGFVRDAGGTITEFDPPGMSDTFVQSINKLGQITGFATTHGSTQGFLRRVNGNFVHIAVPGSTFTQPWQIDDSGTVVGLYADAAGAIHGFTFAAGVYTTIDDPDASQSRAEGTRATAIKNGSIAGYYDDKNTGVVRAFLRKTATDFSNFDAVAGGSLAVFPVAVNNRNQVAGSYYNSDGVSHSFIRDDEGFGIIHDFSLPGATGTRAVGMNDSGVIVGQWTDSTFTTQGFFRTLSEVIVRFTAPVPNLGTFPYAINNSDRITGSYFDLSGSFHGFVR